MTLTSGVAAGVQTLKVMMRDCGLEGGMLLLVAPGMSNEEVVTLDDDDDSSLSNRRMLTSVTITEYALTLHTALRFSHAGGELVRMYEESPPPPESSPTPPPFPPPSCECDGTQPNAPPAGPPSAPPAPSPPPLLTMTEEEQGSDALTSLDDAGTAVWAVGGVAVIFLLLLCCGVLLYFALPRYLNRRKEAKLKKGGADPFPAAALAALAPAPLPAPTVLPKPSTGGWDGKLWQHGDAAGPVADPMGVSLQLSPGQPSSHTSPQRLVVPLHPGWGAKGSWTGASVLTLLQANASSPLQRSSSGGCTANGYLEDAGVRV